MSSSLSLMVLPSAFVWHFLVFFFIECEPSFLQFRPPRSMLDDFPGVLVKCHIPVPTVVFHKPLRFSEFILPSLIQHLRASPTRSILTLFQSTLARSFSSPEWSPLLCQIQHFPQPSYGGTQHSSLVCWLRRAVSGVWGEEVCCLTQQESSASSSGRGTSL